MSDNENSITPSLSADDLYSGPERVATPVGTYRMALAGELKIKKTAAGEKKLQMFFRHVDQENKALKGVNLTVMLEGTDKNGRPKAKQFGDTLLALGIAAADITDGAVSVQQTGEFEEGAEWKGASAQVLIRGDVVSLKDREAIIKVEESTFNGKTTTKATAAYKA